MVRASSTYRETSPFRAVSPLRSLSVDRYVDRVMDDLDVRRAYNRAMSPVRTTTYSYDGNANIRVYIFWSLHPSRRSLTDSCDYLSPNEYRA